MEICTSALANEPAIWKLKCTLPFLSISTSISPTLPEQVKPPSPFIPNEPRLNEVCTMAPSFCKSMKLVAVLSPYSVGPAPKYTPSTCMRKWRSLMAPSSLLNRTESAYALNSFFCSLDNSTLAFWEVCAQAAKPTPIQIKTAAQQIKNLFIA